MALASLSPDVQEFAAHLNDYRQRVGASLGKTDPLYRLLDEACKSRDPRALEVAKAAYEGQPDDIKERLARNGWGPEPACWPAPEGLLAQYQDKQVRRFLQIDGCEMIAPDEDFLPDEDNHVLSKRLTFDLRSSDWPVRLQIIDGSSKDTVLALLRKVISELDTRWESLVNPREERSDGIPAL
ncbi:MAG TPA: hypothetical protein VKI65_19465 [Gemmataceae bacterium]|nr:hypothetical protein [Gemmataceae bacterium]